MPSFKVKKSTLISASLDDVHATVRDFQQWPVWSPWPNTEPKCRVIYADDGRSYSWEGKIVGSGQMAIVAEQAPHSIHYELTFLKPWKSVNKVSFSFAERDSGVETTWTMEGSLPFFMFWMKTMMIAWIGMDYERGLSMLKDYIEIGSVPSKLDFVGPQYFQGCHYIGLKNQCAIADISGCMEKDFQKLGDWFCDNGVEPSGKPFTIYHKWDMVKATTTYTLGFPVASVPSSLGANFVSGDLPDGEVYLLKHTGPYRHLGNAWSAGMMHERAKVFAQNKKIAPFEIYENDPNEVSESDLVTLVHFPLK